MNTDAHSHASFSRYRQHVSSTVGLFIYGFLAPPRSLWTFIRRADLWGKALMPIFTNMFLWFGIVALTFFFFDDLARWLWEQPESALMLLFWWLFALCLGMLMLGFGFLTSIVLIGPLAAPALAELSRTVEREWLGPLQVQGLTWKQFIPSLPSLTGVAIKRLLRFALITLPALLLSFVPIIGAPLAVALEVVVTSFFLAINFMDAPLSRRDTDRRDMVTVLQRGWPACLGLGLALTFMLFIPFVGLLVMPTAIFAGTLVVLTLEQDGRLPKTAPEQSVPGAA